MKSLKLLTLFFLLFGMVNATPRFNGPITFSSSGQLVSYNISQIYNDSLIFTTGSIKVAVYGSYIPYQGLIYGAFLYSGNLNPLLPGFAYNNINDTVVFNYPPANYTYLVAIIFEFNGFLWVETDYVNIPVSRYFPVYYAAPSILTDPVSSAVTSGSTKTFSVLASGSATLTYQWYKAGSPILGATSASYTINSAATSDAGSYSVIVTNSAGSVTSNSATLTLGSSRLYALSVRSYSGSGGDTLIMGVVVSGSGTKNLIARGIGPNLSFYGVSGFLADPQLKLYSSAGTLMQTNDDWGGGNTLTNAFASVGLAALPAASKDAAFLLNQSPGVFTMHLTSVTGTGIGLMELYDSGSDTDSSKLSALSVRGQVGTGANVLIVGFVISGSASKQFIIRGVGPNLAASGVTGYMNDPQLTLFNSSGAQIGTNDDWGGGSTLSNAFTSVGLASMPAASKDAAMLVTLSPGVYTVQLSGVNSTTGVGLIEFYEAP